MDISMESLHTTDGRRGALVRKRGPREIRTLTVQPSSGGLHHVETTLTHAGDLFGWTQCTVQWPDRRVVLQREDDRLVVDGEALAAPADTIPSEIAPLALADMLAASATEVELHLLDEARPTAEPAPAHFSVSNPEPVTLADGRTEDLGAVELFVRDEPTERFWFDSHEIVATDRDGARSYRVESLEELLDDVEPDVAVVVRAFVG